MVDFLAVAAAVALAVLALAVAVVTVTGQSPRLPTAERVGGYVAPGISHAGAAGALAFLAWLAYSMGPGRAPDVDDLPVALAVPVGIWAAGFLAWLIRLSEGRAGQRAAALRADRPDEV